MSFVHKPGVALKVPVVATAPVVPQSAAEFSHTENVSSVAECNALIEDVLGLFGPAGGVLIFNAAGDGETLSCSLQDTPVHLQFTPDEDIWCSLPLGYWGRTHGNDEGWNSIMYGLNGSMGGKILAFSIFFL